MEFIEMKNFSLKLKKDMSNIELMGIKQILQKAVRTNTDAENYFGLAYTSSGEFACYNVLERRMHRALTIEYFAITLSNMLVMVCSTSDEENVYFEVNY